MSEIRSLTAKQEKVLGQILEDWRTHGTAPTQSRIKRLTGLAGDVWAFLKRLEERGYVHQPYEEGPWVPLRDVDGVPVQCEIKRVNS